MAVVSNNNKWDRMVRDLVCEYGFNKKSYRREIFERVSAFLTNRYKGLANKERINQISEEVTESICIKLKISN